MHYGHKLKKLQEDSGRSKLSVAMAVNIDASNYSKILEQEDMMVSTFHKIYKELTGLEGNLNGSVLDM